MLEFEVNPVGFKCTLDNASFTCYQSSTHSTPSNAIPPPTYDCTTTLGPESKGHVSILRLCCYYRKWMKMKRFEGIFVTS